MKRPDTLGPTPVGFKPYRTPYGYLLPHMVHQNENSCIWHGAFQLQYCVVTCIVAK